jgi:hypothetical protein
MADSGESRHVHLIDVQGSHYSDARGCAADCTRYEKVRADTVEIGGRHAVVERGRASGGLEGMERRRVMLVVLPLADGRTALMTGSTGDEAGYQELLAVAHTIQVAKSP